MWLFIFKRQESWADYGTANNMANKGISTEITYEVTVCP